MGSLIFVLLVLSDVEPLQQLDGAALFLRAVEVQTPGGRAPPIRDFQADLTVEFYETDEKGALKGTKSGQVTEFWKKKGERELYRRILRTAGTTTTNLATDGRRFLMWEEGTEGVRDLLKPELKQDLKQLMDELHRTRELVSLFFLANLGGPGVSFVRGEELQMPLERRGVDPQKTIPVVIVTRKKPGEPDLRLSIGLTDFRLYGVEKNPKDPAQPPEQFRFESHQAWTWADLGKDRQCLIPTIVRYFINSRESLRAAVDKTSDIKFNENLSDALFAPPPR